MTDRLDFCDVVFYHGDDVGVSFLGIPKLVSGLLTSHELLVTVLGHLIRMAVEMF